MEMKTKHIRFFLKSNPGSIWQLWLSLCLAWDPTAASIGEWGAHWLSLGSLQLRWNALANPAATMDPRFGACIPLDMLCKSSYYVGLRTSPKGFPRISLANSSVTGDPGFYTALQILLSQGTEMQFRGFPGAASREAQSLRWGFPGLCTTCLIITRVTHPDCVGLESGLSMAVCSKPTSLNPLIPPPWGLCHNVWVVSMWPEGVGA